MGKKIQQIVINSSTELPEEFNGRIYQLGVSGTPGQQIQINGSSWITLNSTGVFQIDVSNDIPLSAIKITEYKGITPLIIDLVIEEEQKTNE